MKKGRMNRRQFLGGVGGATGAALLLTGLAPTSSLNSVTAFGQSSAEICPIDTIQGGARTPAAFELRQAAAELAANITTPTPSCNGDEAVYPDGQASFTKSLPHDEFGEADPAAYTLLMNALRSGEPEDFQRVPMGGPDLVLANPQCSYAYELEGPDSHALSIRPAPSFLGPETAGEMVECYWHALLRDVAFDDFDGNNNGQGGDGPGQQPPGGPGGGGNNGGGRNNNNLVQLALDDLNALRDFRGPKENGRVTPQTLFRGDTPGDLTGPFVSQFLIQPFENGPMAIDQRIRVPRPGQDFMTVFDEWRGVQSGTVNRSIDFDNTPRYIRNGRDLGEYVHRDYPFSAALNAGLILFGMGAPFDEANPYFANPTQDGFGTFGLPHMTYLVTSVANRALKAAWCQKWLINRRLRPEAMGARIHVTETGLRGYLIDDDVLGSRAIQEVKDRFDSYLLPQAYPEGSPVHPSYPAGHATFSGACITMLKAFFDENWVIPNPMRVADNGTELRDYNGPDLTVGGELNKLASNIALGRDIAGVHYRTDGTEGINLGEQLAIQVLRELQATYNERFNGFSFTKFNGERVTIT